MAEQWKSIPGFEGLYEVSDMGKVRSIDRVVSGRWGDTSLKGRNLKTHFDKFGYEAVGLTKSGKRNRRLVHRLVLDAFRGHSPDGMEACHENGDPGDNRLENLRWDTKDSNLSDRLIHGTAPRNTVQDGTHGQTRKTHCPRGHKLSGGNLSPSQLRRGWRRCRSCDSARSRVQANPSLSPDFKKISDQYYQQHSKENI